MKVHLNHFAGRILIVLLMLFFTSSTPLADEVSEIRAMTKEKVDIVINILKDKSLSKDEKKDGILETIDGLFDFSLMARLSLGKKHWKSLSKAKRKEFSDLFVERLKLSYLEKLDLYTDEEVVAGLKGAAVGAGVVGAGAAVVAGAGGIVLAPVALPIAGVAALVGGGINSSKTNSKEQKLRAVVWNNCLTERGYSVLSTVEGLN